MESNRDLHSAISNGPATAGISSYKGIRICAEDDKLNPKTEKLSRATTGANVIKINHQWTIRHISMQKDRADKSIKSSVFCSNESGDKTKWRLVVYPKGFNLLARDNWSVFVQLQADTIEDKESISANVKISLIKRDKTESNVKTFEHCFKKDKTSKGFLKFIHEDQLMDPKLCYIDNDSVTINVQISLAAETRAISSKVPIDVPKCNFHEKIGKLLDDAVLADYTIILEDKVLRVHKIILCAHSPYFAHHFAKNPFELSMRINDIDSRVGEALFHYIYTCQLPNINDLKFSIFTAPTMIFTLFKVASKYRLDHLKALCEQRIVACLNDYNCCEMLNLCENSDALIVKKYTIIYITTRVQDVMKTDGWKQLRPNMLNEIFKSLAEKKTTASVKGK